MSSKPQILTIPKNKITVNQNYIKPDNNQGLNNAIAQSQSQGILNQRTSSRLKENYASPESSYQPSQF